MDKVRTRFLGYRLYRIKFIKIVGFVFLITTIVFLGVLAFLFNTWMNDLRQQAQDVFMERERRLANIRVWALDYTNGMYEDAKLMEDAAALFSARNMEEYIQARRNNSLNSRQQIGYLPGNIKKLLFWDSRKQITGVSLSSHAGVKAIWQELGDVRLQFGITDVESSMAFHEAGDMLVASYPVRNTEHMDQTLGKLSFWADSREIYECGAVPAQWALWDAQGRVLRDGGLAQEGGRFLSQLAEKEGQSGWLFPGEGMPVFFILQVSGESGYSFLVFKDVGAVLADNKHTVSVIVFAFVLVAMGVLACYYGGIRSDAAFLAMIMDMLSAMEGGNFARMQSLALPASARHRENEYGMIAAALKDVGMKLKGYIETEYILKLKEQESQMRALQHQINPHFLYNTLEMLRSKALVHEDRDMAEAIAMLGALYRARMRKKDTITLKEEFAFLEMYLKIMALRFGDNFVYQAELEEGIGEIPTVNFWLQPLAENFFAHGFGQESEYNLLTVNGYAREGGGEILIIDNGCGAAPSKLAGIRRNMREGNDQAEGDIGLRNVYMRLAYFYGDGFRMDVGNNAEGGFRVSIFIPGRVEDVHTDDRGR
ncbi:sensor histidine kinase YpdA [Lachnospiraceae bacterium]|nr:sensor histidine kinase YpdA [Lachnospiraceae bacterium]